MVTSCFCPEEKQLAPNFTIWERWIAAYPVNRSISFPILPCSYRFMLMFLKMILLWCFSGTQGIAPVLIKSMHCIEISLGEIIKCIESWWYSRNSIDARRCYRCSCEDLWEHWEYRNLQRHCWEYSAKVLKVRRSCRDFPCTRGNKRFLRSRDEVILWSLQSPNSNEVPSPSKCDYLFVSDNLPRRWCSRFPTAIMGRAP